MIGGRRAGKAAALAQLRRAWMATGAHVHVLHADRTECTGDCLPCPAGCGRLAGHGGKPCEGRPS